MTDIYPDTRTLFSTDFVRTGCDGPQITPDFSEYSLADAKDLRLRFCEMARKIGLTPGQLLTAAMVTAVIMGEGSTEVLE